MSDSTSARPHAPSDLYEALEHLTQQWESPTAPAGSLKLAAGMLRAVLSIHPEDREVQS